MEDKATTKQSDIKNIASQCKVNDEKGSNGKERGNTFKCNQNVNKAIQLRHSRHQIGSVNPYA